MSKGQFGARHLQKHLWKLPIPEFDPANGLHVEVSQAGRAAADGAAQRLAQLRQERDRVTVTIARRELRQWLRESGGEGGGGRRRQAPARLPVLGAGSTSFPTGDCVGARGRPAAARAPAARALSQPLKPPLPPGEDRGEGPPLDEADGLAHNRQAHWGPPPAPPSVFPSP